MTHAWRLRKVLDGITVTEQFFDGFRKAKTIAEAKSSRKISWVRNQVAGKADSWFGPVTEDAHWIVERIDIL